MKYKIFKQRESSKRHLRIEGNLFFSFLFFVCVYEQLSLLCQRSFHKLERITVLSCNFALNYGHSLRSAFLNLKYIIFSQLKHIWCMYRTMYNFVSWASNLFLLTLVNLFCLYFHLNLIRARYIKKTLSCCSGRRPISMSFLNVSICTILKFLFLVYIQISVFWHVRKCYITLIFYEHCNVALIWASIYEANFEIKKRIRFLILAFVY